MAANIQAHVLDADQSNYLFYGSFKERHVTQQLGGKWDAHRGCWVLPQTTQNIQVLCAQYPMLSLTEKAQRQRIMAEKLLCLRNQEDASIQYGEDIDPYQRVGVKFLVTAGRAILADEIGIGKSVQAIRAAYEAGVERALVITRKSLIYNFQKQLELWSPPRAHPIAWNVTNYEQVVRKIDTYTSMHAEAIIIDEGHFLKGRRTKRTKAIRQLTKSTPYVWLLTGKPVLNRPDELWSLLNIINPRQYSSYWKFAEAYCELEYNPWSGGKRIIGLRQDTKGRLAQDLKCVLLRRTKGVIDLPPITRETVRIQLLPKQRQIYDQMLGEFYIVLNSITGEYMYAPSVLAQLTRLRQIADTPALIGGPNVSVRTSTIIELVENYATDHKILIFTCFASYAKQLASDLTKALNIVPPIICGELSQKVRTEAAQKFNEDPSCRVLIGTYGTCGEGHDFQVADLIILADLDWVPATIEQAEGRAYRRGQDKPVHVVTLVCEETVDEHILEILMIKDTIIREIDAMTMVIQKMRGNEVR